MVQEGWAALPDAHQPGSAEGDGAGDEGGGVESSCCSGFNLEAIIQVASVVGLYDFLLTHYLNFASINSSASVVVCCFRERHRLKQ